MEWRLRLGVRPAYLRRFLVERGSLVALLSRHCRQELCLRLQRQFFARPYFDEVRCLKLRSAEQALIREVVLHNDEINLVYARSVIPRTSLVGSNRRIINLYERPLGRLLFCANQGVPAIRKNMVYRQCRAAKCPGGGVEGMSDDDLLWERQSIFMLSGKPILVREWFLPGMAQVCRT